MITDAINNSTAKPELSPADEIKLRDAAKQFEAILLTQLTSVMAKTSGGEDSLFGSEAGSDLAQKMFSEQLAVAMAESGGIGLGESVLKSMGFSELTDKAPLKEVGQLNPSEVIKQNASVSRLPADLVLNKPLPGSPVNPVVEDGLGVISVDNDSVDDQVWRAPFVDASKGLDVTRPENQVPGANRTEYILPVDGRISSRFGNRLHPIDRVMKFHGGLDIAAATGTPIKAAADGVVVFAGERGGYGNLVEIEHRDGRRTRYAHANTLNVSVGTEVKAGQQIGTVGATGKATGPHLHFEIRENGKPVNPIKLIN